MRKRHFLVAVALACAALQLPSMSQLVRAADVDWTQKKQLNLEVTPLDVASSADGKLIFILTPGDILVYSNTDGEVTDRIPVDEAFDRLTHSARDNTLILSSSWERMLRIIEIAIIHDISVSGLPFKGAENAPVTIAVFNDYQ